MKSLGKFLIPTTTLALSVIAAWGAPNGVPTVGDFAFKISNAMGQRPADQNAAVRALMKAGVDLGKDVRTSLTWDRAATIVNHVALSHGDGHDGSRGHHGKGCPSSPSAPDDCDDDDDDHDAGDDHDGGRDHGGNHDHGGDEDHGGDDREGD